MKILLVRVSSLGDVLHNLPMVADILRRHPGATIDWVVEEGYVSLVRLNPHVRNIIPFALRRWRKSLGSKATRAEIAAFFRALRAERYDYVFDTQGLLKTGVIMGAARLAPGGRKVGLANGSEGSGYEGISRIFHTDSIALDPRTHAVARGRLVAGAALGYGVDTPPDFGLPGPDQSQRPHWMPEAPYAVFFHGTARAAKKWPAANWIATGRALAPMPVLLAWGSEDEKREAELIADGMPNAIVLPKLSMMEAVTLARNAALAIGVDTGLTHIAAAFLRPTIELYCDSPKWKTEGNWSPRIINLGDKGQPPSVDDVASACARLIGAA
ncbi:lipopolysaccharide heptosyltransferase I [Massilia sp. R2A-15]|uniref:lipopolysaccharide heptosyltransferase I n=1 Tax=Massilia sp. R2A-15 TaxID=3064278 RepID=UPI002732BBE8|nr:lipopolysaccharide heptosyltransferase I [Massilia sp. R2A-15]WLI88380.1 lipopolysaccharide heptosyltransferase I [Massilia sp. R2A-15]